MPSSEQRGQQVLESFALLPPSSKDRLSHPIGTTRRRLLRRDFDQPPIAHAQSAGDLRGNEVGRDPIRLWP